MTNINDAPPQAVAAPEAVKSGFTITPYKLEYVPSILAAMMLCGVFYVIYELMHHEIPPANKDALQIVFGAIMGSLTTIVAYYFGSSKSSQVKDNALQDIARGAASGEGTK